MPPWPVSYPWLLAPVRPPPFEWRVLHRRLSPVMRCGAASTQDGWLRDLMHGSFSRAEHFRVTVFPCGYCNREALSHAGGFGVVGGPWPISGASMLRCAARAMPVG